MAANDPLILKRNAGDTGFEEVSGASNVRDLIGATAGVFPANVVASATTSAAGVVPGLGGTAGANAATVAQIRPLLSGGKIAPPSGFSWTPDFEIYRRADGSVETTLNLKRPRREITRYVDLENGNDSNNGETWAAAFKTLPACLTAIGSLSPASAEVVVSGMSSGGGSLSALPAIPFTLRAISPDDKAIIHSGRSGVEATQEDGSTYRFPIASIPSTARIFDFANGGRDRWGNPVPLTSVADLATVKATPGSFTRDVTYAFFHLIDGRTPDEWVVSANPADLDYAGPDLWIENVVLAGRGLRMNSAPAGARLVAKNVDAHGTTYGFYLYFAGEAYLLGCHVGITNDDGISYGAGVNAVEIGSRVYTTGITDSSGASNASTAHQGAKIIRLNGDYANAKNRTVHDVHAGTQSWNINCRAAPGNEGDQASWLVGGSGGSDGTEMWCDGVTDDAGLMGAQNTSASMFIRHTVPTTTTNPSRIFEY